LANAETSGGVVQRQHIQVNDGKRYESLGCFEAFVSLTAFTSDTDVVIVHPKYLDELRDMPEDVLNFSYAVKDV
jgi:hypothetical protein